MKKFVLLFCVGLILVACSDNDKKIIGTWERTVTESDGGRYDETYIFYDFGKDKTVEYKYAPRDSQHIGYKASGSWDIDLLGNLKLYLNPNTAKAVYNFYPDEWQRAQINIYLSGVKLGLAQQLNEMEDSSIGLEITDDILTFETLSGKDRYQRVRYLPQKNNSSESDEDYYEGDYEVDDVDDNEPQDCTDC